MLNSPVGFKTMAYKRCWITCMAGEHPSLERSTCPWVRPPCTACLQKEVSFPRGVCSPPFLMLPLPRRRPHPSERMGKENYQPQRPSAALLVQVHPCFQTNLLKVPGHKSGPYSRSNTFSGCNTTIVSEVC